jgi:hypothetical protein
LISHQRYDRTFGEFLSEAVEHRVVRWHEWIFVFDYRVLLSQLPPTSTIIARPFRPQISVVSDFASVLGLSPSDVNMDPNFRANAQEPISLAIAGLYRNRMGRNIKRDCKQTTLAIARAFDGADIALGITNKRRLIDAFEASNHWMDERYGMPMLAGMGQDVSGPAPAPGSGLDLEAVFSTATLKLIDELCRLETRRKWRVFGWGAGHDRRYLATDRAARMRSSGTERASFGRGSDCGALGVPAIRCRGYSFCHQTQEWSTG